MRFKDSANCWPEQVKAVNFCLPIPEQKSTTLVFQNFSIVQCEGKFKTKSTSPPLSFLMWDSNRILASAKWSCASWCAFALRFEDSTDCWGGGAYLLIVEFYLHRFWSWCGRGVWNDLYLAFKLPKYQLHMILRPPSNAHNKRLCSEAVLLLDRHSFLLLRHELKPEVVYFPLGHY